MRLLLTLLLTITIVPFGYSQNPTQEEMAAFDTLFQTVTSDTIHLFTGRFILEEDSTNTAILGQTLPAKFVKKHFSVLPENSSYATLKYHPDKDKKYTAYLVFVPRELRSNHTLYLFLWSDSLKSFVDEQVVASYLFLEGATEQIRNSIVTDLNFDGVRDIGQYSELIDYEWPVPGYPNVSGSEQYAMFFEAGMFDFGIWNDEILEKYPLRK